MSRYRVDKTEVRAELLLVDGTRWAGHLFLAPFSPRHSGAQTIPELMGETTHVVPFRGEDGRFIALGKAAVAAIRLPGEAAADRDLCAPVAVRLKLVGDHELAGRFLAEQGSGFRLSDWLGAADPWFLLDQGDGLVWVAKPHLLWLQSDTP